MLIMTMGAEGCLSLLSFDMAMDRAPMPWISCMH